MATLLVPALVACACAGALSGCGSSASTGAARPVSDAAVSAASGATGGDPAGDQDGSPDVAASGTTTLVDGFRDPDLGCGWEVSGGVELRYARRFTIDGYEGGYRLLCLADGSRYLVVPEGREVPAGLDPDIIVLRRPVRDAYLAASDTMCLFDALGSLDAISVSGIERDDWSIASARAAMDAGDIVYGGRYRAPDYELLLSREVDLAIESSMINHVPEVREKLVELGIPVLTELSSYEDEPLGRAEWVKLYGVLLGKEDEAEEVFAHQEERLASVRPVPSGKTVAFFYLNSAGAAVVRRPGDYVTRMIEQAGGRYAFGALEPARAGASTMTLTMEAFYATARDADVLVYSSAIDGSVRTLDDLRAKSALFDDFKAVREGAVWVTEHDMYQQMLDAGTVIADLNAALLDADDELSYLRRLT